MRGKAIYVLVCVCFIARLHIFSFFFSFSRSFSSTLFFHGSTFIFFFALYDELSAWCIFLWGCVCKKKKKNKRLRVRGWRIVLHYAAWNIACSAVFGEACDGLEFDCIFIVFWTSLQLCLDYIIILNYVSYTLTSSNFLFFFDELKTNIFFLSVTRTLWDTASYILVIHLSKKMYTCILLNLNSTNNPSSQKQ